MGAYWWSIAGLIFSIFGGFLLSVEAIKLDNLRKLREHYLPNLFANIQSRPFYDPNTLYKIDELRRHELGGRHRLFDFLHLAAGVGVLGVAELICRREGIDPIQWMALNIWHLPIVWRVLVIVISPLYLYSLVWLLGEQVHRAIQRTLAITMRSLEAIERNTPPGTVGIMGFALLFIGFLGQIIGTIARAR